MTSRRRVPFTLFERAPGWGGVIRTERVAGFLLEGGPDSILAQKPDGVALLRELGLARACADPRPAHGLRAPPGKAVPVARRRTRHPERIGPFFRTGLFSGTASCAWPSTSWPREAAKATSRSHRSYGAVWVRRRWTAWASR